MSKLKGYLTVSLDQIKEVDEFKSFINTNSMYDKIKDDIKQNGIKVPLIVNQRFELINGYTRLGIAKELGINEVPVAIYETDNRGDEYDLLISTNLAQRSLTREQALALIEKAVEEKMRDMRKTEGVEKLIPETNQTVEVEGKQIQKSAEKKQQVDSLGESTSITKEKKIENLTDIKNAVKQELNKYNIKINDVTINKYIELKEKASWLADYILKHQMGIKAAYRIYSILKGMGLLDAVANLPPSERNMLLIEGKMIIMKKQQSLLDDIINHRIAVSQAINKLKAEEKANRGKQVQSKAIESQMESDEDEDELEEETETDNNEYPFVEEWQTAEENEKHEKEQKTQEITTSQVKSEIKAQTFTDELNEKGFVQIPTNVYLIKFNHNCYIISKDAIAGVVAGNTKYDELKQLLMQAGYALPGQGKYDTVVLEPQLEKDSSCKP